MTVRLLLNDYPPAQRRSWRWAEYLFLIVGLVGVDIFIWVNTNTLWSEAYGSWSLDRQIAHRPATPRDFIADGLHLPWLASEELVPDNVNTAQTARSKKPARLPDYALIGRIEVPRLGLSAMVREGVGDSTLETAVGHMPSTPLPGEPGNAALAAHRDTLFRKLKNIRKEDRIALQTRDRRYEYVVESMKIVKPNDLSVLHANGNTLTLITCYPFYYIGSAPERFVVRARQVDTTARQTPPPQNQTGS